jgi:hypothetical protein
MTLPAGAVRSDMAAAMSAPTPRRTVPPGITRSGTVS